MKNTLTNRLSWLTVPWALNVLIVGWFPAHPCRAAVEAAPKTSGSAGQRGATSSDGGKQGSSDQGGTVRPRLLDQPFETPRQLLRLLDIGRSDLESFVDGEPISEADEEAFMKILFRMPQIGRGEMARWKRGRAEWPRLRADPGGARGDFFELRGRARTVKRVRVREELAELFAFDHYFEVQLEVAEDVRVTVFTRTVPEAWRARERLDERCRASAMFLKLGDSLNDRAHFLFAARRIAWLPDQVDRELGIGPDQVLLGNLGMDVGLFDAVQARNGLSMNAEERECFYALLSAVGQATSKQMARHAADVPLRTLLQTPERMHGRVLEVPGSVQRITRVIVEEEDIQRRYGIRSYYQLDVLVSLDDVEVRLESDNEGKAGPTYRTHFPFTCCALTIPAEWKPYVGEERAGPSTVLRGVFYKLWSYSNRYVTSFDAARRQLSPMVIVRTPKPTTTVSRTNRAARIAIGISFIMVLALIWFVVWRLNRADRRYAGSALQERFSTGPPNLAELEAEERKSE